MTTTAHDFRTEAVTTEPQAGNAGDPELPQTEAAER